ncbi:hypothetical protein ACVRWT_01735 [Streptococcus porcinus]
MTKKILIVVTFLLLLTGCKKSSNSENTYKKVDITAYYHYNNQPMQGIHVAVFNYETAYRKIRSGKFNTSDFSHYTLDSVRKKYDVYDSKVNLGDYQFGQGIKHNDAEAKAIIKILFENSLDYLTFMNGLKKEVFLSNPENTRYKFSNQSGKLIGNVESGLSILRDTTGSKDYRLVRLANNSTVYLGNSRPNKKPILLNGKQKLSGISADLGEEITYEIPITSRKMLIRLSPNFVIDSANHHYQEKIDPIITKKSDKGKLTDSKYSPTIVNGQISYRIGKENPDKNDLDIMDKEVTLALSKLYAIKSLNFNFEKNTKDKLIIKGHVSSRVNYKLPLILEKPNDQTSHMEKSFEVYNTKSSQGIFVLDENGGILTPQIRSYGINFVTNNQKTNKPISGIQFILGRIRKGKVEVLETNKETTFWTNTHLNQIEFIKKISCFQPFLISGERFTYVDGNVRDIPINYDFWVFNKKEQKKDNEPLYKIRGLSDRYKYFIIPQQNEKREVNNKKPIYFKVNGNSISSARITNYEVNGFVSDFKYDDQEYNAIPVKNKGQKSVHHLNPIYKVVGLLVVVIISYIGVIIFFIKKT